MIRSLEIGKRALIANQRALDVTSNNISNVNTPGYARQELLFRPGEAIPVGNIYLGMGVLGDRIRQFRDQLIDRSIRTYTSNQNYYQQDTTTLQRIEAALGEPGDSILQNTFQAFFDAANTLASNPSNLAFRQLFVERARDVAQNFNRIGRNIEDLRSSTFDQMTASAERINQLLTTLADVNQRINSTLDQSGKPAASLIDQQSQALEELSRYLDISITREPTGTVNVSSGGMVLVSFTNALSIRVQKNLDSTTGQITASFTVEKADSSIVGTFEPQSGQLASLAKHYNVTLNPLSSSQDFSIARELDRLADQFATRVNAIVARGYGLNDSGPLPPGRTVFIQPTSGSTTATTLAVNPALLTNPEDVPTSSQPNAPGNNDIIRSIAALATDSTFLAGTTPEGYYGSITARLGFLSSSANDHLKTAQAVLAQATNEREAFGGVNLDEEATKLITYQRAFEAAARVVTTTSDMLSTVINLGL